jgi:hypothetical protein
LLEREKVNSFLSVDFSKLMRVKRINMAVFHQLWSQRDLRLTSYRNFIFQYFPFSRVSQADMCHDHADLTHAQLKSLWAERQPCTAISPQSETLERISP